MGAPEDVIAATRKRAERPPPDLHYNVWPENWTALTLFLCMVTQWRVAVGMSGMVYLGFEYSVVESQMRRLRIPRAEWPEHWEALSQMELAALPLLNKKKS